MSRFSRWSLGGLLALFGGACAGHSVQNPTPFEIYLAPPSGEPQRYLIQPGDQLEVRFFYAPQNNVILPVRPDGFISLPLANEVHAAGLTADDLRQVISAACERTMKSPEVSVLVRTFSGYKIHVGGQVQAPGIFELAGERTVLQAIFEAGGFLPTASPKDVLVIRPEGNGKFAVVPIDVARILDGSDTRQNITLRPRDAVFVPTSAIANVNRWVDQYIRQNLPFDLGWDFQL